MSIAGIFRFPASHEKKRRCGHRVRTKGRGQEQRRLRRMKRDGLSIKVLKPRNSAEIENA